MARLLNVSPLRGHGAMRCGFSTNNVRCQRLTTQAINGWDFSKIQWPKQPVIVMHSRSCCPHHVSFLSQYKGE